MDTTFIQAIQAAKNSEGKAALIAEAILSTFSNEVAHVARQCVLFHWFDHSIIEGLLQAAPLHMVNEQDVYKQITSLPFIEQLPWGVAYQDLTRQGLLQLYSRTQPELLKIAAYVAAPLYKASTENDRYAFEALFCSIISGDAASNVQLNSLLEQAMSRQDWPQMESLLRLQEEAEQLSFVDPLPRTEHYWMLRSIVDRIQGKLDEAIYDYDHVLALNPENALAYLSRNILLKQQLQHKRAIVDYYEAFRLDPSLVQTYINRGIIPPLHEYPTNIAEQAARPVEKDEGDALQIWADIDAHLQFAEQVIQKSDLQFHSRTMLYERVQRIRARQADSSMYLVVVGESNAGKSTFINALLREELLPTSAVVATTTATQVCYGTRVDLEVCFRNIEKMLSYTRDREQLWQQIQKYARSIHDDTHDIRTYIEALTTNNDVATQIESIVIYHPTSFLRNMTILDTPSINAEYDIYRKFTNDIVQNEADAVVVIIPALIPLSQALTAFLMESLRPYIHCCLFVVTQMDKVQERKRKRLLTNIQTRLSKSLGANQPVVLYESAPQIALDTLQQRPVAAGAEHWYDDFERLEQVIWDRLHQERTLSITESLLRLMTVLFEELGARLQEHQSAYEAYQQAIQCETIQDISAFTIQEQRTYQTLIDRTALNARYDLESYIARRSSDIEEEVHDAIFSVDSASDLKSAVVQVVQEQMARASRAFQRELEQQIETLKLATVRASQDFDARFAQEYRKLPALAGTVSFTHMEQFDDDISLNTSSISYSANKINDEQDGIVGRLGWGGAAIGAAIGTAIMPGIGTFIGLFAGPLLIGLFGPSLQERKTRVWDAVNPALQTSFQNMEAQGLTILNQYEREVQRVFQQRLNTYMRQYKEVVDATIQNQQAELKSIENAQQSIQSIQSEQREIEFRINSLKKLQQQIAQKKI